MRVRLVHFAWTEDQQLQQKADGHECEPRAIQRGHPIARDGITDGATEHRAALSADSLCESSSGKPPRLRDNDAVRRVCIEYKLGDLGTLATAGVADDE
eukprot:6201725-Pleurochrysis_carterae.AAC.3